jgi:hypothetical protein
MTLYQQITRDFGRYGENSTILDTAVGRILITRKQYRDVFGTERTAFKAQSLEAGETMVCKATNPFIALTSLYGFINAKGRN